MDGGPCRLLEALWTAGFRMKLVPSSFNPTAYIQMPRGEGKIEWGVANPYDRHHDTAVALRLQDTAHRSPPLRRPVVSNTCGRRLAFAFQSLPINSQ